jgi:hypothetical protein
MARMKNNTKAVAAQVKPVADNTAAAASRGLHKARAWAAPQVERTGQVIQDTVAPKVADALAASARRIDPGQSRRRRWPMLAGIAALLAAAAGAIVAAQRKRASASAPAAADEDVPVSLNEEAKADAARTS